MHDFKRAWMNHICQVHEIERRCKQEHPLREVGRCRIGSVEIRLD